MKKGLRIGPGVSLPLDAVTETFAILAKRGAGKTYTASVLAEEMLTAELQVVVIDPMSAWWGLRASADGKSEGFPIAVLGGPRGDVPLEATGGPVVADLVVGERVPAIIDVSDFSKGERRRFVTDFLERLYQKNRDPMHVFLEEADLFAPQSGGRGQEENARMLGASYDIVRRGRGRGIGSTLITQRSASISKEVLEQAEILVAMRTTGPRDRKAIEGWIDVHGEEDEQDRVMASLPGLPTGTAWVWWPVEGVLKQVKIRERRTFDSSATPKVGQRPRRPKTVANVDLGALQAQMKETIERAKAEDPKELHKEIRRLKAELGKRPTEKAELVVKEVEVPVEVEKIVEVPVLGDGQLERLEKIFAPAVDVLAEMQELALKSRMASEALYDRARTTVKKPAPRPSPTSPRPSARPGPGRAPERAPRVPAPGPEPVLDGDFRPSTSQQRILDALAWLETIGIGAPSRPGLAFLAHTRPTSGGFKNNLGAMRTAGVLDYPTSGTVGLTDAGRALANEPDAPLTAEELQTQVLERVTRAQAAILEVLIEHQGNAVSREDLAEAVGVQVTSGGFKNNLGALRTLGLSEYPMSGYVAALPVLFLEAATA